MICASYLALLALPSVLAAAQLSLPNQSAGPNASVTVQVAFSRQSDSVSALQFDLQYDASAMSVVMTVGDAARSAGKSLYYTDLAPGKRRFLFVGLNQNCIPTGSLLNLFLNLYVSSDGGVFPLAFSNAVGSDAEGQPLPVTTTDGMITVEGPSGSPLQPQGVLNGGSLVAGPLAPGEIITLIGDGIGPVAAAQPGSSPTSSVLGGTSVLFDGTPAPLLYAGRNQINAIVPYRLAGQAVTQMQVSSGGSVITGFTLSVASSSPAIFTEDASGAGQGVILNEDLTVNSPSNPAKRGSVIAIYATGAGQMNPPGVDSQVTGIAPPVPILPVTVNVGGSDCAVLYAGGAPGLISGVLQVNCQIADSVTPGDTVPVILTIGNAVSPPGVTVAIE
jgi:uncharacterized protein (TIGR03437 family)